MNAGRPGGQERTVTGRLHDAGPYWVATLPAGQSLRWPLRGLGLAGCGVAIVDRRAQGVGGQ